MKDAFALKIVQPQGVRSVFIVTLSWTAMLLLKSRKAQAAGRSRLIHQTPPPIALNRNAAISMPACRNRRPGVNTQPTGSGASESSRRSPFRFSIE
jgi:hypothetical protein